MVEIVMIFVWIGVGFLAGVSIEAIYYRWKIRNHKQKTEEGGKEKIDVTVWDIIRLANIYSAMDINYLILEYKINLKLPDFYEKYQYRIKQEKEWYFNELTDIFSRNKREYVGDLLDKHSGLSKQDVLLSLLCEMQLDNKTMARIMGLSVETLKKRKTRLKTKMQATTRCPEEGGAA